MISFKLVIGRVALLAAVAGVAVYTNKGRVQEVKVESPYFMDYSKTHLIARVPEGVYERYEHRGFDGLEECVQLAETFGQVYMDGADGHCDEVADTIISRYMDYSPLITCDDASNQTHNCNNKLFEMFKENNSIEGIKDLWNKNRYGCDAECKLPIDMGGL